MVVDGVGYRVDRVGHAYQDSSHSHNFQVTHVVRICGKGLVSQTSMDSNGMVSTILEEVTHLKLDGDLDGITRVVLDQMMW